MMVEPPCSAVPIADVILSTTSEVVRDDVGFKSEDDEAGAGGGVLGAGGEFPFSEDCGVEEVVAVVDVESGEVVEEHGA